MQQPSQREKAERFADLHRAGCFVLPNAWDMPSAALIVEAGFPAVATTSAGVSFAQGVPDGEKLSRERMIALTGGIARRLPVPVSADLEAGYAREPAGVADTIRAAIAAGLVGANIEDADPTTGKLFAFELAVARIRAARAAADEAGLPFVVNARTDPWLVNFGPPEACFAEAVRRANAFIEAGARCTFVPGPADTAMIGRLAGAIRGPLNMLGGFRGQAAPALDEQAKLGVRRISLGGSLMLSTYASTRRALAEVKAKGDFAFANGALTNGEMGGLMTKYAKPE